MTPESIHRLYEYSYWAFDRVWDCILPLSDAEFTLDIDYSMGSIRNQVVHLMSSTNRWMRRLQGGDCPHLAFEDYPTRASTRAQWDIMKADVMTYLYSLNQSQLDERIHWEISTRNASQSNYRWELLLHVANHATDHRAQILAMLHHHFDVKTVEQDMLFYLIEKKPA